MSREQELRDQISTLRLELDEIDSARKTKEMSELVGQCFVYQNSYGGNSHWPLYQRVAKYEDGFVVVKAQTTDRGEALFACERLYLPTITLGEPISRQEFEAGVDACLFAGQEIISGIPADIEPF